MLISRISFVFLAFLLTGAGSAQAAPLNLALQTPDIFTSFQNTNYDAVTDIFTVDGFTQNVDGVSTGGGSFSLTATITAGGTLTSGTISITGLSNTLISGDLFRVGFANNGSQVLEFLFTPTGGDLLAAYNPLLRNGGIILSVSGYNDDNFNTSFSETNFGAFSDTAPVPVPAAVWLFGSGLLGLLGFTKRARI